MQFIQREDDRRGYLIDYPQLIGKTIASFTSSRVSEVCTPEDADDAYDITITFTDGTKLEIEELSCSGQIGLTYHGE